MKRFSHFISEAKTTKASEQAKRLGLSGDGHGDWYNAQGEFVAKTVKGELKFFTKGQRIGKRDIPPPTTKKEKDTVAATQAKQPKPQSQKSIEIDTRDTPENPGDDTVTIIFGRFNPPTKGHNQLFTTAKRISAGGEIRVYPSRVKDPQKNPLEPSRKVGFLRKMYPDFADFIIDNQYMETIFDVLKVANEDGYGNANIVVSADRQSEIQNLANKYNGDSYNFGEIRVVSAGNSDSEKDSSGVSSAKMRKFAMDGDFESFKLGMPSNFDKGETKKLYNSLRTAMGQNQEYNEEYDLWKIAPTLDYKNLRENYVRNKVFKLNECVVNLNTGLTGKVMRRGTNYLICVTESDMMFKSWIKDVIESKDIEIPSKNIKKLVKKAVKRVDADVDGDVDTDDMKSSEMGEFVPSPTGKKLKSKVRFESTFTLNSGVPADQRLVGTDSHREYVMRLTHTKEIKNFINKYKDKK